ncbi:MAG: extracellular solute-binding protein, partial [Akkermansia sp.]|nr:extracellular solute-binding protein [Akkermansia sp.]
MFKNILIAMVCLSAVAQAETTLLGAGASFPAPVYQKWTYTYSKENPGTTVTYQSVGSGA